MEPRPREHEDMVGVTEPPGIRRRTQASAQRLPWDGVRDPEAGNPVSKAKPSFHNEDSPFKLSVNLHMKSEEL